VDHVPAGLAHRVGEGLHVLDHVLVLGVLSGTGLLPGTPFHHHVVLQILDQHRGALGVQLQRFVCHRSS
jgi:hypothetical protein